MRKLLAPSVIAFTMALSGNFAAAEVTTNEKIMLQATMQQAIAETLIDGKYLYLDAKAAKVEAIYPAKTHPMIMRMGDHFILCTDFRNAEGKPVNVDFYISRRDDAFVVFDTVVANRAPIAQMMKSGQVEIVK